MFLSKTKCTYLICFLWMNFCMISCAQTNNTTDKKETFISKPIKTGADQIHNYLPKLYHKNIAIVANQTSVINLNINDAVKKTIHLVDFLHGQEKIKIKNVFAPEHGFRGKADAGETIIDGVDTKTGIPLISLYGKNKKPKQEQLQDIDIVVFDIQDVGARFYTYISTLHYVMEACAELNIPLIVLDRPNPNGHYIDGPVLEPQHKSFVGMHPVPIVYGMTIGEYGKMINGENWLKNKVTCNLSVIPLENYTHKTKYNLPIKPSPNLPNANSINLYPSLCFFEGTSVSAGRGTNKQFQIYGAPSLDLKAYSFTPTANEGAKYPKHQNKLCYGEDLSESAYQNQINLKWLIKAYKHSSEKEKFFNNFLVKLAGTESLQKQIESGISENEIKKSWQQGIDDFKAIREKYLIYK